MSLLVQCCKSSSELVVCRPFMKGSPLCSKRNGERTNKKRHLRIQPTCMFTNFLIQNLAPKMTTLFKQTRVQEGQTMTFRPFIYTFFKYCWLQNASVIHLRECILTVTLSSITLLQMDELQEVSWPVILMIVLPRCSKLDPILHADSVLYPHEVIIPRTIIRNL